MIETLEKKKVLYDEKVIHAERIIEKLKITAAEFESNNPRHKNGLKFIISRKKYDHVMNFEIWQLSEEIREPVKEIINKKLIKV